MDVPQLNGNKDWGKKFREERETMKSTRLGLVQKLRDKVAEVVRKLGVLGELYQPNWYGRTEEWKKEQKANVDGRTDAQRERVAARATLIKRLEADIPRFFHEGGGDAASVGAFCSTCIGNLDTLTAACEADGHVADFGEVRGILAAIVSQTGSEIEANIGFVAGVAPADVGMRLTCGAERDMQTMLSLLQASAADGSKAAYTPFAKTRAYFGELAVLRVNVTAAVEEARVARHERDEAKAEVEVEKKKAYTAAAERDNARAQVAGFIAKEQAKEREARAAQEKVDKERRAAAESLLQVEADRKTAAKVRAAEREYRAKQTEKSLTELEKPSQTLERHLANVRHERMLDARAARHQGEGFGSQAYFDEQDAPVIARIAAAKKAEELAEKADKQRQSSADAAERAERAYERGIFPDKNDY